jgi:Domain of unknown function (DUF4340)
MKPCGLLVALLVLLILGGVLYWSEHRKPSAESAQGAAAATPAVLNLNQSAITQVTVKKPDAEPVTLERGNQEGANLDDWKITEPKPLGADQSTVVAMLSTVAPLSSARVVEEKASNLKPYGLDPPAVEVDFTEKDHKSQRLLIGNATPTSGAVYAMLAGDPRVFTISSFNKDSLNKSVNDLRDKRLLTVSSARISGIELIRQAEDIQFGRAQDGWQIVKPKAIRADSSQIDNLLTTLSGATMDLTGAGSDTLAAAFAHAAPIATAKVTGDSGTQVLEVRKSKDQYYAKSSVSDGAYKVDSALGHALEKNLDDFRQKKLFDFSFSDPTKLDLHHGSKSYLFTRSGDNWSSEGKKVDGQTVESLVDKLRDLTATEFPSSGFTNPEFTVTVTSNEGKRVENVSISKSGPHSIAKRENEPSLYQVDSSAVEDIEKAAGELESSKPEAADHPGK